jgi:hypothetical protein
MPERAKPHGEHSEGFFYPTAGNSLLMRIELRTFRGFAEYRSEYKRKPGKHKENSFVFN